MTDGPSTVGQRYRSRRNLVLYVAYRKGGIPMSWLAEVFDLAKARVSAVIRELDAKAGQLDDDQADAAPVKPRPARRLR